MAAHDLNLDGLEKMKILLVEDNRSYAETLKERILSLSTPSSVFLAESRDAAVAFLKSDFFDIIILDLQIPTTDGAFDLEYVHGQQVFFSALENAPGTPVYILTGSEPDAFLRGLAKHGQSHDIWGDGIAVPTVDYHHKEDGDQLLAHLNEIAPRIAATDEIRINTGGQPIELKPEQKRALKVFTRSNGGTSCKLKRLGGLSDAIVLKVSVLDSTGHVRCECVGKLGLARHVRKEITAYNSEVTHLRLGAFALVISYHDQGLRGFSGIFYALADQHSDTFFDLALNRPSKAKVVLTSAREALSRWSDSGTVVNIPVREVRQKILSDENFEKIIAEHELEQLRALDERVVSISASCIHGDLHGGNVLVNSKDQPLMIDFGDVGAGYTCLDPITLELSMLFHPDARASGLSNSLEDSVGDWLNLGIYSANSPAAPIVQFCREWAYDVGPHDDSVLIIAYLFTLRQFKYETVPKDTLTSLLNGLLKALDC